MELVQNRNYKAQNVGGVERVASIVAGGALGIYGIRQAIRYHSLPGAGLALAGAALIKRGATGYCDLYTAVGVNTAQENGEHASIGYQQGIRVDRSITINVPREQAFAFWRDLANLPQFMKHVDCVKQQDDKHSHWIVEGPAGQKLEWDAEIINEIPNELLAWRSLPGASISNAGSVRFEHATAGRGTKVIVSLQYAPPAGPIGAMFAKLFGRDPEEQVQEELHRLKNILEAGEIPTSSGQPKGGADEHARDAKQTAKVQHASEESFPASDAPSYSHVNGQ